MPTAADRQTRKPTPNTPPSLSRRAVQVDVAITLRQAIA
jgi:hypothetical protein